MPCAVRTGPDIGPGTCMTDVIPPPSTYNEISASHKAGLPMHCSQIHQQVAMNVLSNKLYTAFALSLTLYPMSCPANSLLAKLHSPTAAAATCTATSRTSCIETSPPQWILCEIPSSWVCAIGIFSFQICSRSASMRDPTLGKLSHPLTRKQFCKAERSISHSAMRAPQMTVPEGIAALRRMVTMPS